MATRWGIAAAGKISQDFATALSISPKEHQIVAVASRDLSRAKSFAEAQKQYSPNMKAYGSYEELATNKDVEIVYIGTLNPQHLEVAELMLNNGKHILCEKPLTMNTEHTRRLLKLAKNKGLFFMEAVWSRCFPLYEKIKQLIDEGIIGDVLQLIISFGFRVPEVERLQLKHLGGGTVLDLGVYPLQLTNYLFRNEKPLSVNACGHLNENGVDQSVSATLLYSNGRTSTMVTSSLVDLPNEAIIIGTKGTIRLPKFWAPTTAILPNDTIELPLPPCKRTFNYINSAGLLHEANEVRACLAKGLKESSKITHEDTLFLAEMEEEFHRQLGVVYGVN